MGDVPEQVFIDAASEYVHATGINIIPEALAITAGHRAAVASAYRASRRSVAAELRKVIESQSSWLWFELGERALEQVAQRIERDTQPGPAATPDGPRRWALPDEPGAEVTAVRGGSGTIYRRVGPHWQDGPRRGVESWWEILADGPLTDATPAADGQGTSTKGSGEP